MKQHSPTRAQETQTTVTDVVRWTQELDRLHARIAPRFARPEPRRRALADLARNPRVSPRAKTAGNWPNTPEKRAPMGCNGCSPAPSGIPMVCATSLSHVRCFRISATSPPLWSSTKRVFPNRGRSRQASGCSIVEPPDRSRIVRWASFSRMSLPKGIHSIFRELYLPLDWTEDRERCQAAGIPASVRFQTKPELARRMLVRLWEAQVPIAWVVADTVKGRNLDLRTWLADQGYPYVLAVACNEPVGIVTPDGIRRRVEAAQVETCLACDPGLAAPPDRVREAKAPGSSTGRLFPSCIDGQMMSVIGSSFVAA
jgi:hypothetical protein